MQSFEDIAAQVAALENYVERNTEGARKKKEGPSKWWWVLVAVVVVAGAGLAAVFIRRKINKNLRELAKLRTEKELSLLSERRRMQDLLREPLETEIHELGRQASDNAIRIQQEKEEITAAVRQHLDMIERLHSASTWEEVMALDQEVGR